LFHCTAPTAPPGGVPAVAHAQALNGSSLAVTGSSTLLQGTGRDLAVTDGTTYVNVSAPTPTLWRSNWELADLMTPQNNVEMTLLGYSGNTITLSGTQTYGLFHGAARLSGSTTTDTAVYQFTSQDNYAANSPNGGFTVQISGVAGAGGGGTAGHTALQAVETVNGAIVGGSYVGASSWVQANAPATGTRFYGIYPQATLMSGATGVSELSGGEIDISANAGSSVQDVEGLDIVLMGGHAVHGSGGADSGLTFGAQSGFSTGWDYGIRFGGPPINFPFQSTATLIFANKGTSSPATVANGIDFSQITFTGNSFNDGNVSISAAGIKFANLPVGTPRTYACFTATGRLISSATAC
jgi:hypothetical protein